MAYVSNAGWIDGNATDGMRQCLAEEYSSIYVFHLRGNLRTSGELSRKEGGHIFDSGSRVPISIILFVKNPNAAEHGKIYYHDIGDYLSRKEKLHIISDLKGINGISSKRGWKNITPDKYNDWINQRDENFDTFIEVGNKKDKTALTIFENYSGGLKTNRDAWCYNYSKVNLSSNIQRCMDFYNREVSEGTETRNLDSKNISWTASLEAKFLKRQTLRFDEDNVIQSAYRPFSKQFLYYSRDLNERVYQMPQIFPNKGIENRVIAVTGIASKTFSATIFDVLPCLDVVEKSQCFPLKLYVKVEQDQAGLLSVRSNSNNYVVKDGISNAGLLHFQNTYPSEAITKEDVFYYIYGLMHSEDYRSRYAHNLSKQLPRIPCMKKADDFWAFSKAGRDLAELHVNYESVEPYSVTYKEGSMFMEDLQPEDYRVKKMKFDGKGKNKDKTSVIYNHKITMQDIPIGAYDYVVNGKSALEWVMERQCVKTDKASGIVNDANKYATETIGDPAYPLKLFQRVITVSLETMKIVRSLPKLEVKKEKAT